MNVPNALTLARIGATPLIALLAAGEHAVGAAALFALAGLTDWLDGYLARRLGQTSAFGAMFDPIADKLQVGVTLGVLLWLGALPGWHVAPALAILAREVAVSGLREAMAATNAPRIASSAAVKAKTAVQMAALCLLLLSADPVFAWAAAAGLVAIWAAAVLSLWTGAAYLGQALRSLKA